MAITVLTSHVRERCGIDGTDFDTEIDTVIGQLVDPIEYALRPEVLADTDPDLIATLNLGALEIISGEFFCQLTRKPGYFDAVNVFGLEVTPFVRGPAADHTGLKAQGWARLRPYLRLDPQLAAAGMIQVATGKSGEEKE